YIEEIIIDGFKSYATRTVINGWDPQFNAITGLNGSGKSNILDAICFVLGITTLSHVRANNLTDLVYKRGQAGIVRATVTIVFNNSDSANSPPGWEDKKQLSVTRQLNVNNPHFLIMQGKVTKVLNMKPQEILAMIEEAAGTRMFEDSKDKAIKTIQKKDTKLKEINEIIDQEISPKLTDLRDKKRDFLEYQKIENEMETLQRLITAFEFYQCKNQLETRERDLELCNKGLQDLSEEEVALKAECEESHNRLRACAAAKEEVRLKSESEKANANVLLKGDEKLRALEAHYSDLTKELTRIQTLRDLNQKSIKQEEVNERAVQQSKDEVLENIKKLDAEIETTSVEFIKIKEQHETEKAEVQNRENLLQALTTGTTAEQGGQQGYHDQLQTCKSEISNCKALLEQSKMKVKHLSAELKGKEKEAEKKMVAYSAMMKKIEAQKSKIKELEARKAGNLDHAKLESLRAEKETSEKRVKGIKKVVVENENVAALLLEKGDLRKRVTMIPLNKINPTVIDAKRVNAAKSIAPGAVDLALDLVEYSQEVSPAMKYVFGNVLVCKDANAAKAATFNKAVLARSVTIDGDVYDPSGSLSGGSRSASSNALKNVQELNALRDILKVEEPRLEELTKNLSMLEKEHLQHEKITGEIEMQTHVLQLTATELEESPTFQAIRAIDRIKTDMAAEDTNQLNLSQKIEEATRRCDSIERDISELSGDRQKKLDSLQKGLVATKKAFEKRSYDVKKAEAELETLRQEKGSLDKEVEKYNEQLSALAVTLNSLKSEQKELESSLSVAKRVFDEFKKKMANEKQQLAAKHGDIREMEKACREKENRLDKINLEKKKLEGTIEKMQGELSHLANKRDEMLSNQESCWLGDQINLLGAKGGPYDFSSHNITDWRRRMDHIKQRHKTLSRNIDRSVLDQFDRVEKKETTLKQKLSTVFKDKKKITETIDSLDEKKKEALIQTWTKVNEDFGAIFNDLLPDSNAKLSPCDENDLSQGFEVHVSLGGVWKHNLGELSGGQRSLVALSLILSLLQFKPAPMYILDEIDSALDESHTQNIGQLLRTRFKGSQFILVSLKDGMYSNANVLFKAKFRDGVSTVERIACRTSKKSN
ncbi:Structural maintenance of chromosomes protein 2, partial [Blyttiomyces sp. JEL0837]